MQLAFCVLVLCSAGLCRPPPPRASHLHEGSLAHCHACVSWRSLCAQSCRVSVVAVLTRLMCCCRVQKQTPGFWLHPAW